MAVAVPVLAGRVDSSHSIVTSAGIVSDGAVVSTTVIVWSWFTLFPHASVAVQVRVMTDSCAQVPAATLSPEDTAGASVKKPSPEVGSR